MRNVCTGLVFFLLFPCSLVLDLNLWKETFAGVIWDKYGELVILKNYLRNLAETEILEFLMNLFLSITPCCYDSRTLNHTPKSLSLLNTLQVWFFDSLYLTLKITFRFKVDNLYLWKTLPNFHNLIIVKWNKREFLTSRTQTSELKLLTSKHNVLWYFQGRQLTTFLLKSLLYIWIGSSRV